MCTRMNATTFTALILFLNNTGIRISSIWQDNYYKNFIELFLRQSISIQNLVFNLKADLPFGISKIISKKRL